MNTPDRLKIRRGLCLHQKSIIEMMVSDGEGEFSVFLNPRARCDFGVQKIKNAVIDARSLQNHFCGADAFLVSVVVDRA